MLRRARVFFETRQFRSRGPAVVRVDENARGFRGILRLTFVAKPMHNVIITKLPTARSSRNTGCTNVRLIYFVVPVNRCARQRGSSCRESFRIFLLIEKPFG